LGWRGWLRSKTSGGGIAPAAVAAVIEGGFCNVNAFGSPSGPNALSQIANKVLMRFNFHPRAIKG
jgi:hypothetical protein